MPPNFSTTRIGSIILEGWSWWWDGLSQSTTIRVLATLLALILVISWYAWLIKKSITSIIPPLPPGPRGLPLLGNLPFLEPDLHLYFTKLSQIYGPVLKLLLGCKICIVISSPTLAKQVLTEHDAIFANRDPPTAVLPFTYGGVDIAWSPYGPEWRKLRKIFISEMMSKTGIDACNTLRRKEVVEMVKEVHGKVGSPINIGELMFLTMVNLIMSMLWGDSLNEENRSSVGIQFRQMVGEITELFVAPNISDVFPVLARFDLQGIESRMKKIMDRFDRIFELVIDSRMKINLNVGEEEKMGRTSKDFLQLLLEIKQPGEALSTNQIKALFIDIIVAGTDTTTTTVEWAMTELLLNPEIMRKACKELEEVVGNDSIVEEFHLHELHYFNAILKETMRLHPALPLLVPHSPSASCTLSGFTIPKGSRIFFNVWAMQRDPNEWKNPLEFQPERFLKEGPQVDYRGNNFNFMPFGSGRRICVGISLAEKMVLNVLANLLHCFEWNLPNGTMLDASEKFGIVLKKSESLIAIPVPRQSTSDNYY